MKNGDTQENWKETLAKLTENGTKARGLTCFRLNVGKKT